MSTSWVLWSFALLFLIGGPILVYGFTQANRLVCAEHDLHPDAWERDGFTSGFFFLPPGARTRPLDLFFSHPAWVVHHRFFYLGKLIEFGPTVKIFTNPGEKQTEDYITGRFGNP